MQKPCKSWDFNYQPQLVFTPDDFRHQQHDTTLLIGTSGTAQSTVMVVPGRQGKVNTPMVRWMVGWSADVRRTGWFLGCLKRTTSMAWIGMKIKSFSAFCFCLPHTAHEGGKRRPFFHNLHEPVYNSLRDCFGEKVMSSFKFCFRTCFFLVQKSHMIHQLTPCGSWHGSLGIRSDHRGTGISSPFDTSSNSSKESSPVDMAKDGCSALAEESDDSCGKKREKIRVIRPCLKK